MFQKATRGLCMLMMAGALATVPPAAASHSASVATTRGRDWTARGEGTPTDAHTNQAPRRLLAEPGDPLVGEGRAHERVPAGQLLRQCRFADLCRFKPKGRVHYFVGKKHKVSPTYYNCSKVKQTSGRSWADTTGTEDSLGVSMNVGGTLFKVFEVGVEASYEHTWQHSQTVTDSVSLALKPHHKGSIFRAPRRKAVHGKWILHFGDPYHGHYYWFVRHFRAVGPAHGGAIISRTRAMSKRERKTACRR